MTTVGLIEAQQQLTELVERAARGEHFLITNRGKPVARIVPAETAEGLDVKDVIQQMEEWQQREGPTLGPDLTIRDLIEGGRRF